MPTVAVRGLVFAGDATAPAGSPALPALVAKMLSRGTTSRTKEEIGAKLDDVGATRAYASVVNQVAITATGMARDLPLILEILADEYRNPAFRADEIVKARQELENDYKRNDDNTSLRAIERLSQLVYAQDHPYYARDLASRLANLSVLDEKALREYHQARYNGASLIIAVAGDVDAAKTVALVEKAFGGVPRGMRASLGNPARATAAPTGVREAVTMRGKANMNIVVGGASGLRRTDPDYEAALVANAALGQTALSSRLGRRVRDTEGLTYQIYSRYFGADELDGVWFANVNVAPQNLERALKSTREVIAQYAREGASDAEVEAQKSFFAGNFQVSLGSNAGIAEALVTAEKFGFGPPYLDEYPARIRAVTTAQANEAMRRHFFADRLHLIVAGDLDQAPE